MDTKKIILTSAFLGFTLPSIAALGTFVVSAKATAAPGECYSSVHEMQKEPTHRSGCSCPFCQN